MWKKVLGWILIGWGIYGIVTQAISWASEGFTLGVIWAPILGIIAILIGWGLIREKKPPGDGV